MRWLLVKDLQILRRSPLLVGLLIVYPVAIALMIGFALSSPPGKPKVAFYSEVAPGKGQISFGNQQINISSYASQLFQSIDPIKVHSREEAIAKVRNGEALAALIMPADIAHAAPEPRHHRRRQPDGRADPQLQGPARAAVRRPGDQSTRLNDVEQAVSKQVLDVAVSDLQQVLNGGIDPAPGSERPAAGIAQRADDHPGHDRLAAARTRRCGPALRQVISFADLAIEGLGFASPVLGSIGTPLNLEADRAGGQRRRPTAAYAAAIAVVISLMFVTLLLAAGMLALERSENAYARLVRGLVSPGRVLSEKIGLSAGCGGAVTLVMAIFVVPVRAFGLGPLPVVGRSHWPSPAWPSAALGTRVGAVARELNAASLLAFLISLPIAFVALVPASAVSGALNRCWMRSPSCSPSAPRSRPSATRSAAARPASAGRSFTSRC